MKTVLKRFLMAGYCRGILPPLIVAKLYDAFDLSRH